MKKANKLLDLISEVKKGNYALLIYFDGKKPPKRYISSEDKVSTNWHYYYVDFTNFINNKKNEFEIVDDDTRKVIVSKKDFRKEYKKWVKAGKPRD